MEKLKVLSTIETWRKSFKSSESSLDLEADEFVKSAKSFPDDFYFECAAKQTSKQVAESIKKAKKATKTAERMESDFTIKLPVKPREAIKLNNQVPGIAINAAIQAATVTSEMYRQPRTHKADKADQNKCQDKQSHRENPELASLIVGLLLFRVASSQKT